MKRIRCCVIGVFGSKWMHPCVMHEKQVSVWIRREWLWKSGRQGDKSGGKRGGKKGKGDKVVLGKVLLVFVWLCFCLFPFPFPLHPPHHATTHAHTHPPHTMQHGTIPHGHKKHEWLLTRTGHIIHGGDERLETEPTLPPWDKDGLLNNTHLMFKYPPFLVDAHKWCDNKVETCDVHAALKPLHGSQRRTQIVASVSKVAWMRIRRMPSDQTHNHAWRVAHQISLHAQQTDRCKCSGKNTVDHVHFECRFVKPLWAIFTQANRLSVNPFVPQTQ